MDYLSPIVAGKKVITKNSNHFDKGTILIIAEGSNVGDVRLFNLDGEYTGLWACYDTDFTHYESKLKEKLTEYIREKDK